MGVLPYVELLLYRFVVLINKSSVFVAFAILLIPFLNSFIFIVFGLNEASRIAVTVIVSAIVIMPSITLNSYLEAKAIFKEETSNDRTLNSSASRIMYRVALPRILPKVLESIRLKLWIVILLSIAVEWRYAATSGFGYRIFLVRRYVAMDIIIPYIICIGFLIVLADLVMWMCVRKVRGRAEKRYI
jgi:NitT/TauT family transport system permease protein